VCVCVCVCVRACVCVCVCVVWKRRIRFTQERLRFNDAWKLKTVLLILGHIFYVHNIWVHFNLPETTQHLYSMTVFQAQRGFHKILNEIVSDVYTLRKFYQTET
jgi:hypothetical protein